MSSYTGQQISPIKFGKKWRTPRPNDNCEDPNEEADTSLETENVTELCKEFVSFIIQLA